MIVIPSVHPPFDPNPIGFPSKPYFIKKNLDDTVALVGIVTTRRGHGRRENHRSHLMNAAIRAHRILSVSKRTFVPRVYRRKTTRLTYDVEVSRGCRSDGVCEETLVTNNQTNVKYHKIISDRPFVVIIILCVWWSFVSTVFRRACSDFEYRTRGLFTHRKPISWVWIQH